MGIVELIIASVGCLVINQAPSGCIAQASEPPARVASAQITGPERTGESVDVILSAESALVWDIETGKVLYEKNAGSKRPVASISKLLSALAVRDILPADGSIKIPEDVRAAQRRGVDVALPVGEHAQVRDLLAAGLIRSANDAMVALAVAAQGSEDAFVEYANAYARSHKLEHTRLANATGLSGGDQYSTARDVRRLLTMAWEDPVLRPMLARESGSFTTQEGSERSYETTNDLLGTYLPILAAKTGYTADAGENLAIITRGNQGQRIGAVVLASSERFQDMKTLVGWIWRNYQW